MMTSPLAAQNPAPKKQVYVIIPPRGIGPTKNENVGLIVRSAVAFGITNFITIGQPHQRQYDTKYSTAKNVMFQRVPWFFMSVDELNAMYAPNCHFTNYPTMEECVNALHAQGVVIYGVEINERAESVLDHPFVDKMAIVLGRENGMKEEIERICDRLVYIPQYSHLTASINVSMAATIVFHHIGAWMQLAPSHIVGEKFMSSSPSVAKDNER